MVKAPMLEECMTAQIEVEDSIRRLLHIRQLLLKLNEVFDKQAA